MKTKVQKRNEARKQAELVKAKRKAARNTNSTTMDSTNLKRKGKSIVPQAKKKS